jgi:hypothetical protein
MYRKILHGAFERSIPETWYNVGRRPRESETISDNEEDRRSTAFAKHENGRRMRYNSTISCGRDCGKAIFSDREHQNPEFSAKYFKINLNVSIMRKDPVRTNIRHFAPSYTVTLLPVEIFVTFQDQQDNSSSAGNLRSK